jgi:5-hydroxyisourate hydrolase
MSAAKSPITTHILDTSIGLPAANVAVELEKLNPAINQFQVVGKGTTNDDGRCNGLYPVDQKLAGGHYKLRFHTAQYFSAKQSEFFYPVVEVQFMIPENGSRQHYHVPLLLNPYGYSTYRGS